MSYTNMHITLAGILAAFASCANSAAEPGMQSEAEEIVIDKPAVKIYANEYCEIHLTEIDDTTMHAVFFDNEKIVFDTLMKIDPDFNLLPSEGYPFLWLKTGGIQLHEGYLDVHDFAGPAYMGMYVNISSIYDRKFYLLNDTVVIRNVVKHSKGGTTIDGIYFTEPASENNPEFMEMTGVIRKEKYPRAYYSTADSPQGMFADTSEVHYRLVIEPILAKNMEPTTYTGTTLNIDGRAAFIWDFAGSEAYYLDEHPAWNAKEVDQKITINGVLVQFENGRSVLKNWEIID